MQASSRSRGDVVAPPRPAVNKARPVANEAAFSSSSKDVVAPRAKDPSFQSLLANKTRDHVTPPSRQGQTANHPDDILVKVSKPSSEVAAPQIPGQKSSAATAAAAAAAAAATPAAKNETQAASVLRAMPKSPSAAQSSAVSSTSPNSQVRQSMPPAQQNSLKKQASVPTLLQPGQAPADSPTLPKTMGAMPRAGVSSAAPRNPQASPRPNIPSSMPTAGAVPKTAGAIPKTPGSPRPNIPSTIPTAGAVPKTASAVPKTPGAVPSKPQATPQAAPKAAAKQGSGHTAHTGGDSEIDRLVRQHLAGSHSDRVDPRKKMAEVADNFAWVEQVERCALGCGGVLYHSLASGSAVLLGRFDRVRGKIQNIDPGTGCCKRGASVVSIVINPDDGSDAETEPVRSVIPQNMKVSRDVEFRDRIAAPVAAQATKSATSHVSWEPAHRNRFDAARLDLEATAMALPQDETLSQWHAQAAEDSRSAASASSSSAVGSGATRSKFSASSQKVPQLQTLNEDSRDQKAALEPAAALGINNKFASSANSPATSDRHGGMDQGDSSDRTPQSGRTPRIHETSTKKTKGTGSKSVISGLNPSSSAASSLLGPMMQAPKKRK